MVSNEPCGTPPENSELYFCPLKIAIGGMKLTDSIYALATSFGVYALIPFPVNTSFVGLLLS
jgi:hypothetical protein